MIAEGERPIVVAGPDADALASASLVIVGPTPLSSRPSTCQPSPAAVATVERCRSRAGRRRTRSRRTSRCASGTAGRRRLRRRLPPRTRSSPTLRSPPTISRGSPPTIRPPRNVETGPAQDEPDADPDQDQRPQAPQPADLVVVEVAGPDRRAGSRRRGSGRRPSPRSPRRTCMTHTVPEACPAQRPSGRDVRSGPNGRVLASRRGRGPSGSPGITR